MSLLLLELDGVNDHIHEPLGGISNRSQNSCAFCSILSSLKFNVPM
jgi:hypothetical protein